MSTKNVLQPLDVNSNSSSMDKSPAKKRARYNSPPVKERWSLTQNNVQLDEEFDHGFGVLESDTDTQTDDEELRSRKYQELSRNANQMDHSQVKTCSKAVKMHKWEEFLVKKSVIPDNCELDYFSFLSDEIILHVFHFLPKQQLIQVACVCSRFHRLSRDESLWTRMDISGRVLRSGALGYILSRQVIILRLSQSEIGSPAVLPDCRASLDDFQARLLYLDLSMVHVPVSDLTYLFSKCQRLKKLSLEHIVLNNEVLKQLARNRELEVLNLAMAEGVELDGVRSLLTSCKKLRELNISWTFLNSATIKFICANLPNTLDRLNISGCRKLLTDEHVSDLVNSCHRLRELDLSDCTGLTGQSIEHIVRLKELNFLALSRCYLIPYKALKELKKISALVYLDVHGGYIEYTELKVIQESLGSHIHINKFKFSSVARPTVGAKRSSIWNLRVRN